MAEVTSHSHADAPPDRRSFVTVVGALVAGAVAALTPLAVGVASFFNPLRRKAAPATVRVALLDQIPDDGAPRAFPVLADRVDAWNRYPAQRIGAVYLVRQPGEETPVAFTAKCPHAGCFIGFTPGEETFQCPCHTSAFNLDGTRVRGDAEVSPRDMDQLTVELRTSTGEDVADAASAEEPSGRRRRRRQRGAPDAAANAATDIEVVEVWVEFVDFQTGHKERIPTT